MTESGARRALPARALSRVRRLFRRRSDAAFVRAAYATVLRRDADPEGFRNYMTHLARGTRAREGVLDDMISSDEFRFGVHYLNPLVSMHVGRCEFVRSLPRARRILDLGGTSQQDPDGALVALGYPYEFDELVIVDLPFDERHDLYSGSSRVEHVDGRLGPVKYLYQSMTDFGAFDDSSFDLVYSGQSFEHVTPEEGKQVLAGVMRVLRPGGWLALDTPNGPVCRVQQEAMINPDHEIEYSHEEMTELLLAAGFEISEAKGISWMGKSVRTGRFDDDELRRNVGLYHEIEESYLLAYLCQKPATGPATGPGG